MVKMDLFNSILPFMGKKEATVLTLIAMVILRKLFCQTDQVFFAPNAKNNKVDPNYDDIYILLKYA